MKYKNEDYEDINPFEDSDYFRNLTQKVTKTRKIHECCMCNKEIPSKSQAIIQKGINPDNEWGSCYICEKCIDNFLDEEFGEEDE
jgi:uncharacterized protein with PIN domain